MPMSIIYNDTQEKSELQRKITAELRAKQEAASSNEVKQSLTSFDDPDYSREIKLSKTTIWVIILVAAAMLAVLLYMMVR